MAELSAASPLKVAVVGGGRTGHLNAVLFKQRPGVHVSLMTQHPQVLAAQAITAWLPDGSALQARPDVVSEDARHAVGDADVVVITVPAHARAAVLRRMAGSLPTHKPVFVGAIPGFCGFDGLAQQTLADRPNAVIWGMKDVPHTAHALEPGRSVRMGGAKAVLHIATHGRESAALQQQAQAVVQRLYDAPVELLRHYLEITLTPGNPIMHSSVVYGLVGPYSQWHERALPKPIRWWSECPELGAYFLERSDAENQRLCRAVEQRLGIDLSSVKPLRQEIIEAYGDQIRDQRTMLSVLRTNKAYDDILAPLVRDAAGGYWIDRRSRAFEEDVAYGLATLVEMARRLAVPMPHIEEIFAWTSAHMGGRRDSPRDYLPAHWPA
ncbi:NAD/NADP-dependent octopine/nopaline dehydrogenase family protein [Roseateles sp. BYS96W]|uniref:NAD/NADP octopine/nopaline dehydrogenase family protein n=1 Tax=Pelomonas nitida TaxID=3299027 RepID=A0ABW7G1H2_9BURK